jgi:DNA-binding Lrp family transcriptional regulator
MKAYVFVHTAAGKSLRALQELRRLDGITSAEVCWGLPDVIALVEAPDAKALQAFVLDKIQAIAGVNTTDTHLVFEQ